MAGQEVVIEPGRIAWSRRWAVMLDDGDLVFCDATHSLTVVDWSADTAFGVSFLAKVSLVGQPVPG